MRIVMMNPRLRCGIRRRHSTVLVLEEYGHQVELVFTSLGSLGALDDDVGDCINTLELGQAGSEWWNPKVPVSKQSRPTSLDLLHEEDLLDTPEFLRRRTVAVRRVEPNRPSTPVKNPEGGK